MPEPTRRSSRRQPPLPKAHKVALISDTHGLLRPELIPVLQGVEQILHAGDVGCVEVLAALEQIAPVTAVKGNVDVGVPGLTMSSFALRDLHGLAILITHYVGTTRRLLPPVEAVIKAEKPRLVLSGHTHKPSRDEIDGVLFVNPGSCGPKRFDLPISYAMLTVHEPPDAKAAPAIDLELFDLLSGAPLPWGTQDKAV